MGLIDRLMGRRRQGETAPLYAAIVARARQPHWYAVGAVPDSVDGRFDMVAAILSFVLLRLEDDPAGPQPSAALAERFVEDMDGQLRELGVGDIIVGKHIGRMMSMLGGRLGAYRDGLESGDLGPAIARNVYRGDPPQGRCAGACARWIAGVQHRAGGHADPDDPGGRAAMTPEFSRRERLDTIGTLERSVTIEAAPEERAALAERFGLAAIDHLSAVLAIRRVTGGVAAQGRVRADVTQACIATGDPLAARIDEAVALRFADEAAPQGDEIELSDRDLDVLPIENGAIDLGEAAAETLALALDPFPRSPGAAAALREAGVTGEEEARPRGALAGLKEVLEKRQS